jgi:hypothetical protein
MSTTPVVHRTTKLAPTEPQVTCKQIASAHVGQVSAMDTGRPMRACKSEAAHQHFASTWRLTFTFGIMWHENAPTMPGSEKHANAGAAAVFSARPPPPVLHELGAQSMKRPKTQKRSFHMLGGLLTKSQQGPSNTHCLQHTLRC